jgi:hypothetical protein
MAWGLLTGLSIYSFLVTGALVLVTALYANSGTRIIETCKKNNESKEIKTQQLTHVDLFNVDVSGNANDDQNCECTAMEVLGFELFETIILTLVFIGLIFACYKIIVNGKLFILKLREKRALEENRKFEKMRLQYEKAGRSSTSLAKNSTADTDTCAEDMQMGSAQDLEQMTVKFKY